MTVKFYEYAPSPYCRSVKTVARIIGVPLESKVTNIFEKEHLTPEYLAINPFHTIPAIDDNGFLLAESRAIMTYLVDKYSPDHKIYPKDVNKRAMIDQMLYFDSGSISSSIVGIIRPKVFLKQEPSPEAIEKLNDHMKMLDDILAKRKYLASNELSLADIATRSMFGMLDTVKHDYSEFKHISSWALKLRDELPDYVEINDIPLAKLAEKLSAKTE